MVFLNRIYTRTGDDGTTALGSGERCPKYALRIAAYGTVDETNAAIGMARVHLGGADPELEARLALIQNDLFDLGADLCVPDRSPAPDELSASEGANKKPPDASDAKRGSATTSASEGAARNQPLRIAQSQVDRLEAEIDAMNANLKPLRSFVLPAGAPAAAALHVARTIARRAERLVVELAAQPNELVGAAAIKYINRLSDYLFVASRHVNGKAGGDVLWVPGKSR